MIIKRLNSFNTRKSIIDMVVGDCVIFEEPSKKSLVDFPMNYLVGVITKVTPSESKRAVTFECRDAFTGAEFEIKRSYYWPNSEVVRDARIITADEIKNEQWINSISGNSVVVRYISRGVYQIDDHSDAMVRLIDGEWAIFNNDGTIIPIEGPSSIGYLIGSDGQFIANYTGKHEHFWFDWMA